ncbi:MAG: hypothetical protein KAS32_19450 [Candidatus Peribacteraceae bacterium]|nr:hypothetical protein [Candidatus Peribacteraceae bacterium]
MNEPKIGRLYSRNKTKDRVVSVVRFENDPGRDDVVYVDIKDGFKFRIGIGWFNLNYSLIEDIEIVFE